MPTWTEGPEPALLLGVPPVPPPGASPPPPGTPKEPRKHRGKATTVPGAALLPLASAGRLGTSQRQKTKLPASLDRVRLVEAVFQTSVHVEITRGQAGVKSQSTDPGDFHVLHVFLRILGY